jgi:hypothetical protein
LAVKIVQNVGEADWGAGFLLRDRPPIAPGDRRAAEGSLEFIASVPFDPFIYGGNAYGFFAPYLSRSLIDDPPVFDTEVLWLKWVVFNFKPSLGSNKCRDCGFGDGVRRFAGGAIGETTLNSWVEGIGLRSSVLAYCSGVIGVCSWHLGGPERESLGHRLPTEHSTVRQEARQPRKLEKRNHTVEAASCPFWISRSSFKGRLKFRTDRVNSE